MDMWTRPEFVRSVVQRSVSEYSEISPHSLREAVYTTAKEVRVMMSLPLLAKRKPSYSFLLLVYSSVHSSSHRSQCRPLLSSMPSVFSTLVLVGEID